MVSVIIVAYNEAATVAHAIRAAFGHPQFSEVLVVDDGSTDDTALIAEKEGARVIRLGKNSGKAFAMSEGVKAARYDILLFLDADVDGYDYEKLSTIANPVIQGKYEMFVGIRARSIFLFNAYAQIFPIIGGERAMTRSLWEKIPRKYKKGFEIEIASNYTAKRYTKKGMGFKLIPGITHITKERKYGLITGFGRRLLMIFQVLWVSIDLYIFGIFRKKQ